MLGQLKDELLRDVPVVALYEGEGDSDPPPSDPPPSDPPPSDPPPSDPPPNQSRFTQEQVDKIVQERLARDRRKTKEEYETLKADYEQLLSSNTLSEDKRVEYEERLENLNKQFRTKEEQLKAEKKSVEEAARAKEEELKKSVVYWEDMYRESTIERALMDAAIEHEAYNPEHIIIHLRQNTKLMEEVVDGEPTGRLVPMVDLPDVHEETNKPYVSQRTPSEAVARMKVLAPNFFKANVVSGVGGTSNTGPTPGADGRLDTANMTAAQIAEAYLKDRTKLGLKPRR